MKRVHGVLAPFAGAVLASCLLLSGCSEGDGAPVRDADVEEADQSLVAYLRSQLGDAYPEPNAFQQAILAKDTITFADYQSALEAAAACFNQRQPTMQAEVVVALESLPQVLVIAMYSNELSSAESLDMSGDNPVSSPQDGSGLAPDEIFEEVMPMDSNGLPLGGPGSQAALDLAMCEALYAVEVEDWWDRNRPWALTGSALADQRAAFLQCANAAGMNIPEGTSDAKILALVSDIDVFNRLIPENQDRMSDCNIRYQTYLQSVDPSLD